MGNALSGRPYTKCQRLELVRESLDHEKKLVVRKVKSCMIKIGFLHAQIKHMYEQQAKSTNPALTWVTESRIHDTAVSITYVQRDKQALQDCIEQIESMIEAVQALIISANTREILARTGRSLHRASQSHAEALRAEASTASSQDEDIDRIDEELQRANTVLEHTNKVLADVSTRNSDQRALARQDHVPNQAALEIIAQYNTSFHEKQRSEDFEISQAITAIAHQRAALV